MRSFHLLTAAAVAASLAFFAGAAQAKVKITVDLDTQTMHVDAKDQSFDWKVSTGKPGYDTPSGSYRVLWMDKDHHSDEYEQAPMPNSIFFAPGFAIHGFGKSPWGHAASHGCIRLPVAKSAILFDLVKAEGAEVRIVGDSPASRAVASRLKQDREGSRSYASEQGNDPGGYDQQGGNRQAYDASAYDQRAYDRRAYDRQAYEPAPRADQSGYDPRYDGRSGYVARGYGNDDAPQAPVRQEGTAGLRLPFLGAF